MMNAAPADDRRRLDEWFTPGRFAVLLLALICATFPEVVTGQGTFFHRDFALYGYPLAHHFRESIWRGEWPLWNPFNSCGVPFVAQWNTLTLYPPSLLYLLLPLSWSLGAFCLGHFLLAGMGMYFLAYRWAGNRFAAALGGLVYVFSALMLNYLMWPNYIATAAWMPWFVLAMERAWREGGRAVLLAVLAGTMQMLAAAPEMILMTWGFLSLLLGLELIRNRDRWRMIGRFLTVGVVVTALSAAQLLPFLDLVAHSHREHDYYDSAWALPLWGWANFLVPLFRARPTALGVYAQPGQYFVYSYYLGIGTALLALLGASQLRQPRARLLTIVAGFCLIVALGERAFLHTWLHKTLPFLGLIRYPAKYIMLPAFIAPLLAAMFVSHCLAWPAAEWPAQRKRILKMLGGFAVAIGLVVWLAHGYPLQNVSWLIGAQSGATRLVFVAVIAGVFIAVYQAGHDRRAMLLRFGLLFLLWLDVMTMGPRPNPAVPRWVYKPGLVRRESGMKPVPEIGDSRHMLRGAEQQNMNIVPMSNAVDQVVYSRIALYGNVNLLDDIPKTFGNYPLYNREIYEVFSELSAQKELSEPLLDFLAVSQINVPGKVTEWTFRPTHLLWVTGGQRPVFAEAANILSSLVNSNFNPREIVFLPPEARSLVTVSNRSQPKISPREFSSHQVRVDVVAPEPALVVIGQSFYHNWHVEVDGRAVPLLRANHGFQALEVPAGQHQVRLFYRDRALQSGVLVSLLTAGLCAVWWWRSGKTAAAV